MNKYVVRTSLIWLGIFAIVVAGWFFYRSHGAAPASKNQFIVRSATGGGRSGSGSRQHGRRGNARRDISANARANDGAGAADPSTTLAAANAEHWR